jgi:RNA polymerase sigma-70 factor (ECF subfamily)
MQRDLVIRAGSGDHEAFTLLARATFDQLYRTARLILRDDDRALDAVQEALLSAWLHVRAVRDPDRFEAWLRRLLIRACFREARRVGRRLSTEQRAVLVVHHDLGLPDGDAAVVLDIPLGTYKSRLNRATAALRAALETDERTPTLAGESLA